MSKHVITLTVDFDETNADGPSVLPDLVTLLMSEAIDAYEASPTGRSDGYNGPFLLTLDATLDGKEVNS
jgi:hypothetical protein